MKERNREETESEDGIECESVIFYFSLSVIESKNITMVCFISQSGVAVNHARVV